MTVEIENGGKANPNSLHRYKINKKQRRKKDIPVYY